MVVVDGQGVPLGKLLESASPAEVKLLARTLATVRVPRAGRGRPKSRLRRVIADKAYDSDRARRELKRRGFRHLLLVAGEHGSGQIRTRHLDARGTQIGHQHLTEARPHPEQLRRPATG